MVCKMKIYFCQLHRYPSLKRDFKKMPNGSTIGYFDINDMQNDELKIALQNQDWSLPSAFFDPATFMYFHTNKDILLAFMNGWSNADSWYRNVRFLIERYTNMN